MSIQYCHPCDEYVDTDFNAEHFDEEGNCAEIEEIEQELKEEK